MAAETVYMDAYYGAIPDLERPGIPLCRTGQYVAAAALDADSIIIGPQLPIGAKLLAIEWKCSALGVGRTMDIGIAANVDLYVDGADVSAAANGRANCINEDIAALTPVQAKILGDTFPIAAQLDINIWYKMGDSIDDEA